MENDKKQPTYSPKQRAQAMNRIMQQAVTEANKLEVDEPMMKWEPSMEAQQQNYLAEKLADRLTNLEYQMANKDRMTSTELQQAIKDYEIDRESLMQLILAMGKEMDYPPKIKEWSDTRPMGKLNRMANGKLARTDAYQEIMGALIMT